MEIIQKFLKWYRKIFKYDEPVWATFLKDLAIEISKLRIPKYKKYYLIDLIVTIIKILKGI
ncbi:MAG: hypothetical protein QW156_05040 [Candidatus Aenigmatarchaeota archaeon]